MSDLSLRVRQAMAQLFDMTVADIPADADVDTLDMWDSLAHLGLIQVLSTTFDVTIPFEEAVDLISVEAIVDWLQRHHAGTGV